MSAATLTEDWRQGSRCAAVHPDSMFPEPTDAEGVAEAKALCLPCPVREACLEWAMATGQEHGVWGGLAENERRALRRRRQRQAQRARQAVAA